jgi:hypothetical protein
MEAWRAVNAHTGDVEAQNGALEVLWTRARRFAFLGLEQDPDPH